MRSEKVSKKRTKPYNNRLLYSLVAVAIIVALAVGIYAGAYIVPGANTKTPNPGHNISQIQTCGANQILQTNSTGDGWRCVDLPSPQGGITESGWQDLTLKNGWTTPFSGQDVAQYEKVGNFIFLKGSAYVSSGGNKIIFTLPDGYKPAHWMVVPVQASMAADKNRGYLALHLDPYGNGYVTTGTYNSVDISSGLVQISLDGVSYSIN